MAKADADRESLEDGYKRWSGTKTTEDLVKLLERAKPVISASVKSYAGVDDPAAYSHARLLAAKAIRGYDPSKGTKLQTHLMTQLQPLRRFAARRRNLVKVPEQVQYELAGVAAEEERLREELARDPSEMEIAEALQMSPKKLAKLRKYRTGVVAEGQMKDETGAPVQVSVASPGNSRWFDYVYHDVSPIDRKILEWRTGYNGVKMIPNGAIANKLGLSAGAVSQRVAKLRELLERGAELRSTL